MVVADCEKRVLLWPKPRFWVVWERKKEERDFRVAEVIEGSHYRYTVASLLSFALLMIYRKQINDLHSTKQITKDIAYLSVAERLTESRDSFRYILSSPLLPFLRSFTSFLPFSSLSLAFVAWEQQIDFGLIFQPARGASLARHAV